MPSGPFRVALTFDAEHPDRPSEPEVHDRIVDLLERHGIRATFFVQGRWVEAYPRLARALPAAGHLVGSHSFYHVRMPLLSGPGFETDVRRAERVIRDTLKIDPRPWFRLPFGSGANQASIHTRLAALGYRHIHWDVDAREWRKRVTSRQVEEDLVAGTLERGDGAIVLLHSWPALTLGALDGLVTRLRERGARFVGVDELDAA